MIQWETEIRKQLFSLKYLILFVSEKKKFNPKNYCISKQNKTPNIATTLHYELKEGLIADQWDQNTRKGRLFWKTILWK